MAERLEPTIRCVSVGGPVTATVPATREQLTESSARYLPAGRLAGYVDYAWREHGEQVVIHMRPQRWSSGLGQV